MRIAARRAGRLREDGIALMPVLMATTLVATLAAALVLVVMSDSLASANHGAAQQALYAADAALEQTAVELRTVDWRLLPGSGTSRRLDDAGAPPSLPGIGPLDLARLTAGTQAETDARYGSLPDRPVWRVFGRGSFARLLRRRVVPPAYLVVWVADDADERDGNPGLDTNGIVLVRAEAFGPAAARRSVEATLALQESAVGDPVPRREVRMLAWRESR